MTMRSDAMSSVAMGSDVAMLADDQITSKQLLQSCSVARGLPMLADDETMLADGETMTMPADDDACR